jgi:hypothetical protein
MSPYDGIAEEDLLVIKSNLLKILKGDRFSSQNVPGLSYARRIESLADVRTELVFVQAALDALDSDTAPVTRSFLRAV